jgi:hypothetical protein
MGAGFSALKNKSMFSFPHPPYLPTTCQEILQCYKITLSLCNTMSYRIYDVLGVDSMSGNFTYCIPNTMHNLNEIHVLHVGMALALNLRGGCTFELRQPKKGNMP